MPRKPKPTKQFRKPPKPHSLKKMVKKILADPDYARFIHDQVLKARRGDPSAISTVSAHFRPLAEELKALQLKRSDFDIGPCPGTTGLMMIDFAAPHHVWRTNVNRP
jgi:hypothetical protein